VTTEDDFQSALDKDPEDWQTRLVFADWLQEHNDLRAEGYRVLGELRRVPDRSVFILGGACCFGFIRLTIGLASPIKARALNRFGLPSTWWYAVEGAMYNSAANPYWRWFRTRRQADDAAALAYLQLPSVTQITIRAVVREFMECVE
jgi:uncharacterized protein (TIGR02996 family)